MDVHLLPHVLRARPTSVSVGGGPLQFKGLRLTNLPQGQTKSACDLCTSCFCEFAVENLLDSVQTLQMLN